MAEEYISFLKISYGFSILTPTLTDAKSYGGQEKKKGSLFANQNPAHQSIIWFYARKPDGL